MAAETESNMTNEEFVGAVKTRLTERGLPSDFIDKQCEKLLAKINDLPAETASRYASESNVELISTKIAEKFSSEDAKKDASLEGSLGDKTKTMNMPQQTGESASSVPHKKSAPSDVVVVYDKKFDQKKHASRSLGLTFGKGIASENEHPTMLFAALLLLIAPVGVLAFGVSFIAFLAVFLALAAVIVLMVGVIIAVVGIGSLISVASLLYGATQVLSNPRYIGIHEIGLGLLAAGITIFVSVILYNIALKLVPFIYAKLLTFINFSYRKTKEIFIKAKKGCENL